MSSSASATRVVAGSAVGMTIRNKRIPPAAKLASHSHDKAYCCLLLKGRALERSDGAHLELSAPSFIFRPPGTTHSVRFDSEPAHALTIELEPERLRDLETAGIVFEHGVAAASSALVGIGERLSGEIPIQGVGSPLLAAGLALEMLGLAAREIERRSRPSPPLWLRRARQRLLEEPNGIVKVEAVARQLGVHPSHLASAFRSWYGESPGELVRRKRVEYAARALRTTDLCLAEIALAAGYYDQSHFTNAFKRRTGLTPAAFRRSAR